MSVSGGIPISLSSLSRLLARRENRPLSLRSLPVIIVLCSASVFVGCSGGGGSKTGGSTAPSITSLSPTSGAIGAAVTIAGSNFGSSQGTSTVTFNGTAAAAASAWSATSITVTVPSGATTGNVVVTVGGQASNGVNFTVTTPAPSITSLSPTSGAVGASVTITGSNFGSTQGSSTVTFNGTSAGTASAWSATSITVTVPSGATTGNVVVTVGGQASNGVAFTVNAANACTTGGSESLLNGSYAFLLQGFDSAGNPAIVIGALTFNGTGTITAGAIDMNLDAGVQSNLSVTSGNYGVGADQRGCLVVTTSFGTQNYRLSLGGISGGVASLGHMIDFDAAGPFTAGILRKQSGGPFSNASANGSYAFGGSSSQNSALCASPCQFGVVGVVGFDGNGDVTGGSQDDNANGTVDGSASNTTWPASPIPIDSGSAAYSVTANGRATLTLSFGGGSSNANDVLYLVSSSEAFFMVTDPQTTGAVTAGTALLQSGTPFAANPLSGSYVGYDSGNGITGVGRTDLYLWGPFTSGNNALNGVGYRNTGGTFGSVGFAGSTYSASSIGRAIVLGTGGHAPLIYLVSPNEFFFLESNESVDFGFFQLQSGSPFSNSSASGAYAFGEIDPEILSAGVDSGMAIFTPTTTSISVTLDENGSGGAPTLGTQQSFTYSIDSTGQGLIPSGCSLTATPITCNDVFFVISPTRAVVMDPQASGPQIQTVDQ